MTEDSLFKDEFRSTAIYPNRIADKEKVEAAGLKEKGDETTVFHTPKGTHFATGYVRVVYGDHGPYIEFDRKHIKCLLIRKFARDCPPKAYYEWLMPSGEPDVKVYDQKRDVKHLKNPPYGGFIGFRKEGYADYKPGLIYVSPKELKNS